jgi:hypothetical protein
MIEILQNILPTSLWIIYILIIVGCFISFFFTTKRYEWNEEEKKIINNPEKISKFNYQEEINPIAVLLCEADKGSSESNFGQMKELLKKLAIVVKNNPSVLDTIKRYSESIE